MRHRGAPEWRIASEMEWAVEKGFEGLLRGARRRSPADGESWKEEVIIMWGLGGSARRERAQISKKGPGEP